VREKNWLSTSPGLVEAPKKCRCAKCAGGKVTVLELKCEPQTWPGHWERWPVANAMRTLLRVAAQDSRVVLENRLSPRATAWSHDPMRFTEGPIPAPLPCFLDSILGVEASAGRYRKPLDTGSKPRLQSYNPPVRRHFGNLEL